MPPRTREIVSHLANLYQPQHFRAGTSRRFCEGSLEYGVTAHLRPDCAETCHKCNARLIDHYPCSFCPYCGADIRPYDAALECAEELQDAGNQAAIAQRRHAWPDWKVQAVAKLCGIGLAILDADGLDEVKEYVQLIRLVRSAADLPTRIGPDDMPEPE